MCTPMWHGGVRPYGPSSRFLEANHIILFSSEASLGTKSQFPMGTFTKKRFSMFKGNIIDSTAVTTRQPKRTVAILIEAFLDCIERGLARDGIARLRGFGSFYVRMRKARSVR